MLRRAEERGELQPPLGEERRSRLGSERRGGIFHGRDFDPPVARLARPRRAGEDDERRAGGAAGGDGVGRHARREWMGRVDDGVDALVREIGGEARGAAEAADAQRDRRRRGIGGRARKREERLDLGVVGDPPRERARFRRAAENEQAKALQGAAPW